MVKAILFDIDGVIIRKYKEHFSEKLVRKYHAPAEQIRTFFNTTFKVCQLNQADLKTELGPELLKWNWKDGVDNYLDLWFKTDGELDLEVIKKIDDYRKNFKCYLASQQEKYRGEYLLNTLGLKSHVDGFFFSYTLGIHKGTVEFYKKIAEKLKLKPKEIVYFDDNQENVDLANSLGIHASLFRTISDLTF